LCYSYHVRLTEKGQVTIPIDVRRFLGLHPGDDVEFVIEGDVVRVNRSPRSLGRGKRIIDHLRAHGADVPMTTDEIMALTRQ
jgi:AbrB family looped-hinge helix DNA binding protein